MAAPIDALKPIFPKYNHMRTNDTAAACYTYLSSNNPYNIPMKGQGKCPATEPTDPFKMNKKTPDWRGRHRPFFFSHAGLKKKTYNMTSDKCDAPPPVVCRGRTRTRCTQTKYRESSAQTRPYQPEPAGRKEDYEDYEVYIISKLLDTDTPPGEYEVKVVERNRRRRLYMKALKLVQNDKVKHRIILEAMEWEEWIAREEDILNCQRLRMEIVERKFAEREIDFHTKSAIRIQSSFNEINAKRLAALQRARTDYARGVRRLETERHNISRKYRKGNIVQDHIDPASDMRAPQIRFGTNPNRRHFVGFRKNFDDRIDQLDKQKEKISLAALKCPFSKLKAWSKPKETMKEISLNFCSEENLKNLYESLKDLRIVPEVKKPQCLKKKVKPPAEIEEELTEEESGEQVLPANKPPIREDTSLLQDTGSTCKDYQEEPANTEELIANLRQRRINQLHTKIYNEVLQVVGEFENMTIGKMLQLLSDELQRLKEQKKFQAIFMLAERQRWEREAQEAGRRQKENYVRVKTNKLFDRASKVHMDTASIFLHSVLEDEFNFTSEMIASDKMAQMGRRDDILSMKTLTVAHGKSGVIYEHIRSIVRNQMFEVVKRRLPKINQDHTNVAKRTTIEEELHRGVKEAINTVHVLPDDVNIVGQIVDDLVEDAVVYDFGEFSSESEDEFDIDLEIGSIVNRIINISTLPTRPPEEEFHDASDVVLRLESRRESSAILRKLVRKIIRDETWKSQGERIAEDNVSRILNDVVNEFECLQETRFVRADDKLREIINNVYKRIEKVADKEESSKSEGDDESPPMGWLSRVPSTTDIFEPFQDREMESDDSADRVSTTIDKQVYSEAGRKFDVTPVKRIREQYDIFEKSGGRYKPLYNAPSWESMVSIPSCGEVDSKLEVLSYTSMFRKMIVERATSAVWLKTLHPDFVYRHNNFIPLPTSLENYTNLSTLAHKMFTEKTEELDIFSERRASV